MGALSAARRAAARRSRSPSLNTLSKRELVLGAEGEQDAVVGGRRLPARSRSSGRCAGRAMPSAIDPAPDGAWMTSCCPPALVEEAPRTTMVSRWGCSTRRAGRAVIHAPFGAGSIAPGAWPAQAHLPELRLRAAGGGHRRRRPALPRPPAQLPARERVRDGASLERRAAARDAALQAPMSPRAGAGTRAARLALSAARRAPRAAFLQRMRAETCSPPCSPPRLGCQDNAVGPIEIPDHPLVKETLRDCLTEAMDAQGLKRCSSPLQRQDPSRRRETPEPSVFAHEILNANPSCVSGRRAAGGSAGPAPVTLRRGLPRTGGRRGAPRSRGHRRRRRGGAARSPQRHELHDLLLDWRAPRGPCEDQAASWTGWLDELIAGQARRSARDGRADLLVAAERRRSPSRSGRRPTRARRDRAPARGAPVWSDRDGALSR